MPQPCRHPSRRPVVVVKVGSLDDPTVFGGPALAIFTCDMQSFHMNPEGVPAFARPPPELPPFRYYVWHGDTLRL